MERDVPLAMSIFGRLWGTGISGRVYKDDKEIKDADCRRGGLPHGIACAEDRQALRAEPESGLWQTNNQCSGSGESWLVSG